MAIKFDVFEIPQTKHTAEYAVFYRPRIVQAQTMTTKELARKLSERTTLTNVDIESVLIGLGDMLRENISAGRGLHIDNLGTFAPSIRFIDPTIPPERIKSSNVKLQNILFYPEKEILAELQHEVKFVRGNAYHSENVTEGQLMIFLANYFASSSALLQKTLEHELNINRHKASRLLKSLLNQHKLSVTKVGQTNFYSPGPQFARPTVPEAPQESGQSGN